MSRESLSMGIVRAIAEREGIPPSELGFSLQEYIDADALDALGTDTDGTWTLEFTAADHEVTVDSDGTITIDGIEHRWQSDPPKTDC